MLCLLLLAIITHGLGLTLTSSLASNAVCPALHVCQFSLGTSQASEVVRAVEVRSMTVTGGSLYQSPYTANTAPVSSAFPAQPTIACDSFVTFALASRQADTVDCTALSPDFVLTDSAFSGSYFCNNPGSSQTIVTSSVPMLVAQLAVQGTSTNIALQLRVYKSGAAFTDLTASCQKSDPATSTTTTSTTTRTTTLNGGSTSGGGSTNGGGSTSGNVQTAGASSTSTAAAGVSQAWIAAAVIVPLFVVALVALIIALAARHRRQMAQRAAAPADASFAALFSDGGVGEQWGRNTFPV